MGSTSRWQTSRGNDQIQRKGGSFFMHPNVSMSLNGFFFLVSYICFNGKWYNTPIKNCKYCSGRLLVMDLFIGSLAHVTSYCLPLHGHMYMLILYEDYFHTNGSQVEKVNKNEKCLKLVTFFVEPIFMQANGNLVSSDDLLHLSKELKLKLWGP